jgi:hypothetical protein
MDDSDRLDLSALDPTCEPDRWQIVVEGTLLRVNEVLARRAQGPLGLIASWARPLLIAGAVAVAVLVPVEIVLELHEPQAEQVRSLVTLSAGWESGEQPPSGAEFLRALAEKSRQ